MPGIWNGIGLMGNVAATSGGGPAWTPNSISNMKSLWLDPRDLTTLFKDTAATTQVTADGDSVAAVKDKFSGTVFAIQATAGNQPVYRANSGKPYLDFTGGKWLESSTTKTVTDGSGQHWSIAAVQIPTVTGVQNILDADSSSRISQFIRVNSGTAETIAFNTAVTAFTDGGATVTAAASTVLREVTSTTACEVFVNGASGGSTAITGTLKSGATETTIGAHDAGASPSNAKIYGALIIQGLPQGSDATSADTYFAALM